MNRLTSYRVLKDDYNSQVSCILSTEKISSSSKNREGSIRKRRKGYLTNQQQIQTAHFFEVQKVQNISEIQKQFGQVYQFLKWSQNEEQSLIQFESKICMIGLIQNEAMEEMIMQLFNTKQKRMLFRHLGHEIQANIFRYIQSHQILKQRLYRICPSLQKNPFSIKKKPCCSQAQKADYCNRILLMLRSDKNNKKIGEYCLIILHQISCNMGKYEQIINGFESDSKWMTLRLSLQELINKAQNDVKFQILYLMSKIMTIVCLIYIKFNKQPENGSMNLDKLIENTIILRIKYEGFGEDKLDEIGKQSIFEIGHLSDRGQQSLNGLKSSIQTKYKEKIHACNRREQLNDTETILALANLTIFLFYKHIQFLTKNLLQSSASSQQRSSKGEYEILSLLGKYRKCIHVYLNRIKKKELNHHKMSEQSFDRSWKRSSQKISKYQNIQLFKDKLEYLLHIFDIFEASLWEHSKKNIVSQSYDLDESNQQLRAHLSQKQSSFKIQTKHNNKYRSLTSLLAATYTKKQTSIKKWAQQKFFKTNQKFKNSQLRSRSLKSVKKPEAMSQIVVNNFENTKNALQQISLEIQIKKNMMKENTNNNQCQQVKSRARKKGLNGSKRKKIYEMFRNNKKMVYGLSGEALDKQLQEIEDYEFYNEKEQIRKKKENIVNHCMNVQKINSKIKIKHQASLQTKSQIFMNRQSSTERSIKIIKYIAFKPVTIQIKMTLLDTSYLIRMDLTLNQAPKTFEIMLPKSHHIFTGKFETIWPTMKYFFRKKIMQYWVFSQHQESFSIFNSKIPDHENQVSQKNKPLITDQNLIDLFGCITEEQLVEISEALGFLVKFIDVLLYETYHENGRKIMFKQIYNQRLTNICLMHRKSSLDQNSHIGIKQIKRLKLMANNMNEIYLHMKESVFLLANQKIILGVDLFKTNQRFHLMSKGESSSYSLVTLVVYAQDLLTIIYSNTLKISLLINNHVNKSKKLKMFNDIYLSADNVNSYPTSGIGYYSKKNNSMSGRISGFADKQLENFDISNENRQVKTITTHEQIKSHSNTETYSVFFTIDQLHQNQIQMHTLFEHIKDLSLSQKFPNKMFKKLIRLCFFKLNLNERFVMHELNEGDVCPGRFSFENTLGNFQINNSGGVSQGQPICNHRIIENCFNFQFQNNTMYLDVPPLLCNRQNSKKDEIRINQYFHKKRNQEISKRKLPKEVSFTHKTVNWDGPLEIQKYCRLIRKDERPSFSIFSGFSKNEQKNKKQNKKVNRKILKDSYFVKINKINASTFMKADHKIRILLYAGKFKKITQINISAEDIRKISYFLKEKSASEEKISTQGLSNIKIFQKIVDSVATLRSTMIPKPILCIQGHEQQIKIRETRLSLGQRNSSWGLLKAKDKDALNSSIACYDLWDISNISSNLEHIKQDPRASKGLQQQIMQQKIEQSSDQIADSVQDTSIISSSSCQKSLNSNKQNNKQNKLKELKSMCIISSDFQQKYLCTILYKQNKNTSHPFILLSLKLIGLQEQGKQQKNLLFIELEFSLLGLNLQISTILIYDYFLTLLSSNQNTTSFEINKLLLKKINSLQLYKNQNRCLIEFEEELKLKKIVKQFLKGVEVRNTNKNFGLFVEDEEIGKIRVKVIAQYNPKDNCYYYLFLDSDEILGSVFSCKNHPTRKCLSYQFNEQINIDDKIINEEDSLHLVSISLKTQGTNGIPSEIEVKKGRILEEIRRYKLEDEFTCEPKMRMSVREIGKFFIKKEITI